MRDLSRKTILARAVSGRCPRCRQKGLFMTRYRLNAQCPHCGLPVEKEDGWSLGAIPLNYTMTCVFWVLPLALLFLANALTIRTAMLVAGAGCLVLPLLTYRFSKLLWLGIYYAVLPHELDYTDKNKGVSD